MDDRLVLRPFPDDFRHKGKYIVWSKTWDRIGYAAVPQYAGQMAIIHPEDATTLECFLGGYLIAAPRAEG